MKKLMLVLAIALIASPALGALTITLERIGQTNDVDLKYSGGGTADSNQPRAFAFTVKTSNTAKLSRTLSNYMTGESNQPNHKGFGIYPARIVVDTAGVVSSYGNPLSDPCDPGASGTAESNSIVVEFGSLYFADTNAPAASGTLCRLKVVKSTENTTTLTLADEDTYRGGTVFEDGSQGNPTASLVVNWLQAPGPATVPVPGNAATNVSRTIVLSWTAGTGTVDSRDVYFGRTNPPPFKINQTAATYDPCTGNLIQGQTYWWKIDEKNTAGTTSGTVWSFTVEECLKSTDTGYSYWKFLGKPSCWCFKRQCRGDSSGTDTLSKPVAGNDFTNFQSGFNIATTLLSGKKDSNGFLSICADYTHTVTLGKPVAGNDFTAFQTYFNKARTSVPECAGTNINFWMN